MDTLHSCMAELAVLAQSPIYQDVLLICQDEILHGSRLLLALAYPSLTETLKGRDDEELVLLLPDFLSNEVRDTVENFLEGQLGTKDETEDEEIEMLDPYNDHEESNSLEEPFPKVEGVDPFIFLKQEGYADEEDSVPCMINGCSRFFTNMDLLGYHRKTEHRTGVVCPCCCGIFLDLESHKQVCLGYRNRSSNKTRKHGVVKNIGEQCESCKAVINSVRSRHKCPVAFCPDPNNPHKQLRVNSDPQKLSSLMSMSPHDAITICQEDCIAVAGFFPPIFPFVGMKSSSQFPVLDEVGRVHKTNTDAYAFLAKACCHQDLRLPIFYDIELDKGIKITLGPDLTIPRSVVFLEGKHFLKVRQDDDHTIIVSPMTNEEKEQIKILRPKLHCDFCPMEFSSSCNMQIHVSRVHTNQFDFQCDQCEKKFVKQFQLDKHKREHDDRNRTYTCEECGKAYYTKNRLKKHAIIHSNERPYPCRNEGCEKTFKSSGTRRIHERSEMGMKPFKCEYCNAAFARADHMKKHRLIHTGEMNYACGNCGKRFIQKGNKNTHELKCNQQTIFGNVQPLVYHETDDDLPGTAGDVSGDGVGHQADSLDQAGEPEDEVVKGYNTY